MRVLGLGGLGEIGLKLLIISELYCPCFDEVAGAFVGVEAERGEVLFVGGGEVLKFVDDPKGSFD